MMLKAGAENKQWLKLSIQVIHLKGSQPNTVHPFAVMPITQRQQNTTCLRVTGNENLFI